MTHTILVYGTLRPFANTDVVKVPGKLYDLGWYPGIVLGDHENPEEGVSFVTCERITADWAKLAQLDNYEGYDKYWPEESLYIRKRIPDKGGALGFSWIYVYNKSVEGHELIESGDWELHTKQKEKARHAR